MIYPQRSHSVYWKGGGCKKEQAGAPSQSQCFPFFHGEAQQVLQQQVSSHQCVLISHDHGQGGIQAPV